ncbi:hypothetical protein [Jannaschia aquimarina]|uniref:Uncharacterized protein n=1 Tax=Jannaschia aquimarina TaxID=935700 RepID=A0A0D1DA38_9RHOB|nr:hypothetical protein [Jannaschia aquimarina]KIT16753.1 hypothetical protein jaqu_15410 [Jannaschia aquimarina]SNS53188.1 hypothetical protein SAMN05421775_101337 [Jannaschia aquimarina]
MAFMMARLAAAAAAAAALTLSLPAGAEEVRQVWLEGSDVRLAIAEVTLRNDGTYEFALVPAAFENHFLSMRPFRCIEGAERHLCHVPYPYAISRDLSDGLTDLEYDLLFVWKGAGEYGINMWNGMYWKLERDDDRFVGVLHEMDMDALSVPPPDGEMRPIRPAILTEADPDDHPLPRLVVE